MLSLERLHQIADDLQAALAKEETETVNAVVRDLRIYGAAATDQALADKFYALADRLEGCNA